MKKYPLQTLYVFLFLCFLQRTALYVSERATPIREKVKQTFLIMRHTYTTQYTIQRDLLSQTLLFFSILHIIYIKINTKFNQTIFEEKNHL